MINNNLGDPGGGPINTFDIGNYSNCALILFYKIWNKNFIKYNANSFNV